ncbi:MAG TPA: hypothetical protein VF607_03090 [Verrucomicrobiae bacterium]
MKCCDFYPHLTLFWLLLGGAAQAADLVSAGELSRHNFFYAGEAHHENMYIVRAGEIVWQYQHPADGEISDATLLPDGRILFAHQHGVTLINAAKEILWHHEAPAGTEIHTAQMLDANRLFYIQNGNPAKCVTFNVCSNNVESEFVLPTGNPNSVHGQFRHARLTPAGTLLVAHMDIGRVTEYDWHGKPLWSQAVPGVWSAVRLANGHTLATSSRNFVREYNSQGQVVWEWTTADAPQYPGLNLQLACRLPNGNTLINSWFNEWSGKVDPTNAPPQALEITPEKKIVWVLRAWAEPVNLGPATTIQLLDQ